ncbi:glycosyltransferase [Clostridium botulinum]|uniref:glycosyltransferase family 2 protein n=1 Tax=Clostridium TaxID=1485 RepID=UPI0013FCAAA0|nr:MULTISPECIES: glycosyltransferase [Clostridium]MCS6132371.1 glycosyltransferase [Clostridium botulinum]NFL45739.1 glycosyltransferase [Clostridium botulinum]NFL91065.1 glycosyltransferase [Clostridium botulinum]
MDLSIIVPVYNVEQYLKKCLDTLINQNQSKYNYEIICINDGSTDNSFEILKNYQKKYSSRIKVIDICNLGVSNARNIGIDNSIGKYITFVDSDDWVDHKFVDFLMQEAEKKSFSIFNSSYVFKNKSFEHKEIIEDLLFNVENSVCAKIFKREKIVKYNIKFPLDITMGEDLVFTFSYICCVENYKNIDKVIYYYRQNRKGSLMNSKIKITYKQVFKACECVYNFANKNNLLEENLMKIEYLFIKNLLIRNTLKIIKFENGIRNKTKQINNEINFVNKYFPNWIDNQYILCDADGYVSEKLGTDYMKVLNNLETNKIKTIFYFIIGKIKVNLRRNLNIKDNHFRVGKF